MDLSRTTTSIKPSCSIKSIISVALLAVTTLASAKRLPPPQVVSINAGGVEYSVPQDRVFSGQLGGFIEAKDQSSHLLKWRKQVYHTSYNSDLERDIQDVFITSLTLSGKTLMVRDEKSRVFCLDTDTQWVTQCS